jgi:hypothetical protein
MRGLSYQQQRGINTGLRVDLVRHKHGQHTLWWQHHCSPLRVRFGRGVETETPGDGGMLGVEPEGASPLMISCIEASSASTRCDICTTVHTYDLSNQAQNSPKQRQHTAVNDLRGHIVEFRIELFE